MIITICGSMKFAKEMLAAKTLLEEKGHRVFIGPLVKHFAAGKLRYKKGKEGAKRKVTYNLIKRHLQKIEKSGAILVLNHSKSRCKNYIGGNTLMEMGYAFYLDKKFIF